MGIYLETNALRKLTDYKCDEHVYTSIFSIFELLSGITDEEKEFKLRKVCIDRIFKQRLEIRGPMVDKLFMQLVGSNDFNENAYKMIWTSAKVLHISKDYADFKARLSKTFKDNYPEIISPIEWLAEWDRRISNMTKTSQGFFRETNAEYIRGLYEKPQAEKEIADYFFNLFYNNRYDNTRLSHAEPFVGAKKIEETKLKIDDLFSKYNFKLFITAQAVIFAKVFIDGGEQHKNNPSDLLHLLYLTENDKLVSNDNIYENISKRCEYFNYIKLEDNEKSLSDLMRKQSPQGSN